VPFFTKVCSYATRCFGRLTSKVSGESAAEVAVRGSLPAFTKKNCLPAATFTHAGAKPFSLMRTSRATCAVLTVQGAPLVVDAPVDVSVDALVDGLGGLAPVLPPAQPVSAISAIAVLPTSRFTVAPWSCFWEILLITLAFDLPPPLGYDIDTNTCAMSNYHASGTRSSGPWERRWPQDLDGAPSLLPRLHAVEDYDLRRVLPHRFTGIEAERLAASIILETPHPCLGGGDHVRVWDAAGTVWLTDVAGLSRDQASEVMQRSAQALLRHAIAAGLYGAR